MNDVAAKKLALLGRVQRAREIATGKKLGAALENRDQIQRKGEQLENYLSEYESALGTEAAPAGAAHLLNYRHFLGGMHSAKDMVLEQADTEERTVESLREEWLKHRAQNKVLEKLLHDRHQQEERLAQKRADQEVSDQGRSISGENREFY